MISAEHGTALDSLKLKPTRDYTRQQCSKTLAIAQPEVNENSGKVEGDALQNLHVTPVILSFPELRHNIP